jgi:hypothetical protein
MRTALARALSVDDVNQLGLETGQSERLRTITPHRLFLSTITALAAGRVESLADLLRAFNHQNDVCVAYKAFYNRLARAGFADFMRQMFVRLVGRLAVRTLEPADGAAVARFKDIVIQDGSSFALKNDLEVAFPGRFTNVQPAAVEVHATYSGFADEVITVHVAPDSEAERQFLPSPESLRDRLLLADRGYPSVAFFSAVADNGGSYIIRLSRSTDPWVLVAIIDGHRHVLRRPLRLSALILRHQGSRMDLDVEFERHGRVHSFRVLVLPGREQWMTRLATNLGRSAFSAALVGKLYRFRWQIELVFKEWKSYANLHKFNTANRHIAEGLIWASLCAAVLKRFLAHAAQLVGGVAMSTRRVAMCVRHVLDELIASLLTGSGVLEALRRGLTYLLANARRAHPDRDRRTGRLRAGLVVVGGGR